MPKNKTIKFFISSTFKDFEAERNILQKFVFPKLKELCNKNGFGFQPIDLRWGIQEEAGLDQQTMNICLNEIKRSSHEPRPNLLILVGQRYGWIPLPYEIKKDEFKIIVNSSKILDEDKNLINFWYEKDENSTENLFYLKNKHHLTREEWNEIEKQIRVSFQKVFDNPKDEEIYRKYNTSATEQEMYLGLDAFDKNKNHEHTFAYFRKIINYNNENVCDYIDKDLTKLKKLWKKLRKKSNIPPKNQNIQKNVQWNEIKQSNSISYNELNLEKIPLYLKEFHDQILEKFSISIETEIKNFQKQTQLQIELEQQENFLKEKSEIVLGRDDEIKRILEFIKDDNEQFYLQYGKSGSGKTSVMAKAISKINTKKYEVYYRFIGTTSNSTYSRILFENIFWQIEANLENDKKISKPLIEIEEREFKKQFKLQLEKLNKKKVVIFLDALDQFEDYNDLTILLDNLPSNIKVVFSTLYDENKKDNSDYSKYFNRLNHLTAKYELETLGNNTNVEILKSWLESNNRELTKTQWNFLSPFIQDITPLHLRLIFEIIKNWKSEQKELHLENTQEKLIIQFFNFTQKQYHHKKELLKETLGLISASKDGLSEEELIDLFSDNKEFLSLFQNYRYPKLNRLPNAIWSRFYYYIEPFFTEKLIDNVMLIKPYHRIVEEVIKDIYYKNDSIEFHKKVSAYFYKQQDRSETWDKRYYSVRMLSELPYQLYNSKNHVQLKEILFDLEFAGSIYDNKKNESFRSILEKASLLKDISEDEIYPWESFYREKEHLILKVDEEQWRSHQSLFQLAYEDGWDSILTKNTTYLIQKKRVKWNFLGKKYLSEMRRSNFQIFSQGSPQLVTDNIIIILNLNTIYCYYKKEIILEIKFDLFKKLDNSKFIIGIKNRIYIYSIILNKVIVSFEKELKYHITDIFILSSKFVSILIKNDLYLFNLENYQFDKIIEKVEYCSIKLIDKYLILYVSNNIDNSSKTLLFDIDLKNLVNNSCIDTEILNADIIDEYFFKNMYLYYIELADEKGNKLFIDDGINIRLKENLHSSYYKIIEFKDYFITFSVGASEKCEIIIHDKYFNKIKKLSGHKVYIEDIFVVDDYFISIGADSKIIVWNNKLKKINTISTEKYIQNAIFKNNSIFCSHDTKTEQKTYIYNDIFSNHNNKEHHNDLIYDGIISDSSKYITISRDGYCKIWSKNNGKLYNKFKFCNSVYSGYKVFNFDTAICIMGNNSILLYSQNGMSIAKFDLTDISNDVNIPKFKFKFPHIFLFELEVLITLRSINEYNLSSIDSCNLSNEKFYFDYEHLDNDYFYNFINIKSNNLMKNYKIDIDNNSLIIKSGNNVIKYIFSSDTNGYATDAKEVLLWDGKNVSLYDINELK